MTNAVDFKNVSKQYGSLTVLRDVTFSVRPGEKISLIGPSGSGKTTILRILMTLETINSGAVNINGEVLHGTDQCRAAPPKSEAQIRAIRSQIGMVFQSFNLFPHMNVLKNITLGPVLTKGLSQKEAADVAVTLLEKVGLRDKALFMPHQLSGGQKQRVAIARALALQPSIMLFDEVTSALDPELVEEVLSVMLTLARETDMTMLLVTHAMSFARDFADRVLFFDGGRIVEEGASDVIFKEPREERTRAFLRKIIASGQTL